MIICANCSRENADHYKFCLGCGTELAGGGPSGAKPGGGVPKLGRAGGGKLKLKGSLFAKDRPAVGLGGLGLSRRLTPARDDAADEVESAPEAEDDDAVDAPVFDDAAESIDDVPAPGDSDNIVIADDEDETRDDVPETDGFDGEIEPFEEADGFDGIQIEAPEPAAPVDDGADPAFDDDFDIDDAPAVAPAVAAPVQQARAIGPPPMARPAEPVVAEAALTKPVVAEAALTKPVAVEPVAAEPVVAEVAAPIEDEPDDLDDSLLEDALPAGRVCQACNAIVPDGFKFCGVCGSRYDAPQPAAADDSRRAAVVQTAGAPSAHLVLIHPDGTEGEIFPLSAGETTVGRENPSAIFAEDPFLSPRHATFYFVQGQLYVRDEGSLNGVFLRIRAEVELFHWDMFRIGQQLLRFEEMSQVRPVMPGSGDGTTVMGSPVRGTWGRLASVVALDTTTSVWALRKPEVYMGRERGEMVFPDDGFVSGSHAKLAMRRGRYFLGDLDSTNGTYLRIKGEGIVTRGDLLLLGQQLFKVQLNR